MKIGQTPVLSASHVSFNFHNTEILSDISLDLHKQDVLIILGLSGSGKSTLLRMLSGLLEPTKGAIYFHGDRIDDLDFDHRLDILRDEVGYLYQVGGLISTLTVRENIALPLRYFSDIGPDAINEAIHHAMETLDLESVADRRPSALSLGQQKMVAFAQLTVRNPAILFLDEPTASVDARSAERIMDAVKLYNILGGTVVGVTHDMYFARAMAAQMAVMDQGRILCYGSPFHVAVDPNPHVQQVIRSIGRDAELAEEILRFLIPRQRLSVDTFHYTE